MLILQCKLLIHQFYKFKMHYIILLYIIYTLWYFNELIFFVKYTFPFDKHNYM